MLIAVISCKKQGASPSLDITGKWELRSQSGGWTPTITYPKGNGNIYVFTAGQYQVYRGGSLLKQGTYTIAKKTSLLQNTVMDALVMDNATNTVTIFVEINGNQLSLWLDAYDAGSSGYERIE
ncbi:hypothetical protein ACFGVR_06435 [Mucilaginibacter sp. AW1-3]